MKLIPITRNEYQTYPIDDKLKVIEITDNEFERLQNGELQFTYDLKGLEEVPEAATITYLG